MPQAKPCEKCGRDYYPLRRGYCHRCDMQRRARYGYQCSFVDAAPGGSLHDFDGDLSEPETWVSFAMLINAVVLDQPVANMSRQTY